MILVVGSAGLASNLVGLVLFHDHGHGGHSHSHTEPETSEGHIHSHDLESAQVSQTPEEPEISSSSSSISPGDENGAIDDILPETIVRRVSSPMAIIDRPRSRRRSNRARRQSFASVDDIFVSPAANRRSILSQAQELQSAYQQEDTDSGEDGYNGDTTTTFNTTSQPNHKRSSSIPHENHNHAKSKDHKTGSGGHAHRNLNMQGVFLHVLGDALGNIGVIATALFIWLTDFSWRFYMDPVISLVITAIIFSSALPLVKSASLILLQGVPRGISLDDVKEDILEVFPPKLLLLIF